MCARAEFSTRTPLRPLSLITCPDGESMATPCGSCCNSSSGAGDGSVDMTQPRTNYAKCGDLNIAYQVLGDGPIDLVFIPSWFSHVELFWQNPYVERELNRLATFTRLILFD